VIGALLALGLGTGACYEEGDYTPSEALVGSIIVLVSVDGQTTLPADGVSRLALEARLLGGPSFDHRTVLFRTTAGTLEGGSVDGDAMAVEADGGGRARIDLLSAQQVGGAVVTATPKDAAGVSASLEIAFLPANPDEVIRFVAAPATAPADGATLSGFTVQLSPALPLGTEVVFRTTLGTFAPGDTDSVTLMADGSFQATADLKSPAADSPEALGIARIRATANQVTREATIAFHRALPDRITVSTGGKFQVMADGTDSVTVTGTFLRDLGQVTAGTVATFRAGDSTGASIGFFGDVSVVGAGGEATATFLAGTTAFRGRVTLTVGAEGGHVTGTAEVEVIDPG
jgi:hypothetical protein